MTNEFESIISRIDYYNGWYVFTILGSNRDNYSTHHQPSTDNYYIVWNFFILSFITFCYFFRIKDVNYPIKNKIFNVNTTKIKKLVGKQKIWMP